MGLLECAKKITVWRGMNYYFEEKVINLKRNLNDVFTADVLGSSNVPYSVKIDLRHPWKSTCNCPYAAGKRIVCKHMAATYFAAYPVEIDVYQYKYLRPDSFDDLSEEELSDKVYEFVEQMSRNELIKALLDQICYSDKCMMEKFLRDYNFDYNFDEE